MTKKKNITLGRPDEGISQRKVDLRMPSRLAVAMDREASERGVSVSEIWRRAARAFIGIADEDVEEIDE